MATKRFEGARNADGTFPTDGIESSVQQSSCWTDEVNARVTAHYLANGVSEEDLQLEKRWEMNAHLKAREAAHQELVRLAKKGGLSSNRGLDRLITDLTLQLMVMYATSAKRNLTNSAEQAVSEVQNLILGDVAFRYPKWMKDKVRAFHNVDGKEESEEPAWVNLLSCGFLAVTTIVDYAATLLTERDGKFPMRRDVAIKIGERLNREIQGIGWYRLNVDGYEAASRKLPPGTDLSHAFQKLTRLEMHRTELLKKKRKLTDKQINADLEAGLDPFRNHPDLRKPTDKDYLEKWSEAKVVAVGSMYLDLLAQCGYLTEGKAAGNKHAYESISFTEKGKEVFAEAIDKNLTAAYQSVPMLIPPINHSCRPKGTVGARDVGGFLLDSYAETSRRSISGSRLGHHTAKAIRDEKTGEPGWITDGLNAAQSVQLALNEDVYEVLKSIVKNGCPMGVDGDGNVIYDRLSVHSFQLFSKARKDDLEFLSDSYGSRIEDAKAQGDRRKACELRRELRYRKKKIHEQAQFDQGNAARIRTMLWTCEELVNFGRQDKWWLSWFLDSRGRAYGLGALNPIEREVSKSLILMGSDQRVDFTGDSKLEEQVRKDLLWTIATCWGSKTDLNAKSDKLAKEERSSWAGEPEQVAVIKQIGSDPLHPDSFAIWAGEKGRDHLGRTVLKGGGSDPFMFVAACMEYVALFGDNPTRSWTQLPSGLDCTGSGLQMASASTCDRLDAALCNVARPEDADDIRPQDVYIAIFQAGIKLVNQPTFIHQSGATNPQTMLGDSRFEKRLEGYGLARNCAKPVGMIATYGGSPGTNMTDVLDLMRENQNPFIPRFQGVDEAHEAELSALPTEQFHALVSKQGQLPRWRTAAAMLERINEIRADDQRLVDDSPKDFNPPSAMTLFTLMTDSAPVEPNIEAKKYKYITNPEERKKAFDRDVEEYREELELFNLSTEYRANHNAEALRRIDDVLWYLNAVRKHYGLGRVVRKPGEIKTHDVDPLIYSFVRAMRSGLELVVPSIVNLRDQIKLAVKEDMDWDKVDQQGGAISWAMPHGWITRQRHLTDNGLDMNAKHRVFTAPTTSGMQKLEFASQLLQDAAKDPSEDSILEAVQRLIEEYSPQTKEVKWSRDQDMVDALQRRKPSETDRSKHVDAIVANYCHSCDSALAVEIRRQLSLKGVNMLQVHDCFFVTIGRSEVLLQAARDAIKELFGAQIRLHLFASDLSEAQRDFDAKRVNEIYAKAKRMRPLDMFCRDIGLPHLVTLIRHQPDHERYYDPAEHADDLMNFIC